EEGAAVMVADLDDERGRRLAGELGSRGGYVHTDVSREADIKAAVDETCKRFGQLDCIFNNAGYAGVGGKIEDVSAEGFDATIGVLLRGVFLGMKHAAPVMKRQGGGSIISTASVAGLRTGLGPHIYSAAKAAVIHLTRTAAMELGEASIRVNSICPGGIATPSFGKGLGMTPAKAARAIPCGAGARPAVGVRLSRASGPGSAGSRRRAGRRRAARGGWTVGRRRTTAAAPSARSRRRAPAGSSRAPPPARGPPPPAAS